MITRMAILTWKLPHLEDWELAVTKWFTWQSRLHQRRKRLMMMTVMMMTMMTLVCFFRKVFFAVPLKSFYLFQREVDGDIPQL